MTGVELITEERNRHESLGYDAIHDKTEINQELAVAAGLYALDNTYATCKEQSLKVSHPQMWPWLDGSYPDKRGQLDRIRQLSIAGALIAAEIDRLQAIGDD